MNKVAITAAATNYGSLFFSISQGYTNSNTFLLFLLELVSFLDE